MVATGIDSCKLCGFAFFAHSSQRSSFSSRGISFSIMPGSQTPFIHRIYKNVREEENISHVTPSSAPILKEDFRQNYQLQVATSVESIGVAESAGRVASTSGEADGFGTAL